MLLTIFAAQLLGGMVFASVCFEPCPDDAEGTSCPPVCVMCTGCTHAQTAIVKHAISAAPMNPAQRVVPGASLAAASFFGDDIFHVPLPG